MDYGFDHLLLAFLLNIGAVAAFSGLLNFSLLSVYLGVVLFGTYFPFTARRLKSKGCHKYIHIIALVTILLCSMLIVGAEFINGGYHRTMVPIFCLAEPKTAFEYAVVPPCFTAAIFVTLVMVLLFKIIDREEWHCMKMKVSIILWH